MITFSAARAASLALIGFLIVSAPAHAVTVKQLQQQLNAKKVRAGSVPGHPNQMIRKGGQVTRVPAPAPVSNRPVVHCRHGEFIDSNGVVRCK
jgi:hypothetical protein